MTAGGRETVEIQCVGKDGDTHPFEVLFDLSEDGQTLHVTVRSVPPPPEFDSFDFTFTRVADAYRQTSITHHDHVAYVARGIPEVVLPLVKEWLGTEVESSPADNKEGVFRSERANKMWDRLVKLAVAQFVPEKGVYRVVGKSKPAPKILVSNKIGIGSDTRERDETDRRYFADRYDEIVHYGFVTQPSTNLNDHDPKIQSTRRCRFCKKTAPEVSFKKKKAHAVSEQLGCKTIVSMNECRGCNEFFSTFENDLGAWSNFLRSITQIKGKDGVPDYTTPSGSVTINNKGGKQTIQLTDQSIYYTLKASSGPVDLPLPDDCVSPPFIPLHVAKTLVKEACSVAPVADFPQCENAIQWVRHGKVLSATRFPILRGFTPGPQADFKSKIRLLRAKFPGEDPYLICVIQSLNHRFQFFVPGCPADVPLVGTDRMSACLSHYYRPPEIPFDWPYGQSDYYWEDYADTAPSQMSIKASLCGIVVEAEDPPGTT
jgi:hypothetical protein